MYVPYEPDKQVKSTISIKNTSRSRVAFKLFRLTTICILLICKEVQGLVDKDGKLSVPIPPEFRALVGDYASKLASKIGVEVRTRLPNPSVRRWKYVDASVKEAMFQRLNDQFDLQGDPIDIEKAMNTKFGRRLSNHSYRLHKQFMELKEAKGEEYARNHPPKNVDPTKWIDLIDKKWNTKEFLEQSKANIANRERMYTKHRCGSRSIPVRVEKLAREKKMLPDLAELYKETHYNEKTHEWISSQAQCNYPGSTPLTAEELSIKVLKPRSGYVRGLGMRPSSSIRRATTIYAETNDYVKRLEMQIETQKEQIQMQNNKIEDLEEGKKKQGEIMADVVNFLRTKGFTGHFGSGGDSSTSGRTSCATMISDVSWVAEYSFSHSVLKDYLLGKAIKIYYSLHVSLGHLPKLTHVWKDNLLGIQGFKNLTSLNIKGCGSLRYVFPSSISKLLMKLQEIEVTECHVVEVIIGGEELKVDDEVATNILMFPQLKTLKLRDLTNLRSFCLQAYTFERSLLKTVEVINCPNMKDEQCSKGTLFNLNSTPSLGWKE
ncbi:unnamed protein product [Camellia sinensis]